MKIAKKINLNTISSLTRIFNINQKSLESKPSKILPSFEKKKKYKRQQKISKEDKSFCFDSF